MSTDLLDVVTGGACAVCGSPMTAHHDANVRANEAMLRAAHADVLNGIAQLLVECLAELKRLNSTDRTGAVSSLQIEDAAKGDPRVCSKHYAGSPLTREDADTALDVHGYAHRRAAELAMAGWQETVDALEIN